MIDSSSVGVEAGQAVYTERTLAVYDCLVLGLSNRVVWRCPTRCVEELYRQHVSADHLDVGVGTGYFLDRCHFPSALPRIALMDLNPVALEFTARRIARYGPRTYCRNVLEPICLEDGARFDSVAVQYLLHCLPGSMKEKAVVFDHLKELMRPNAVLFGATLLQGGVRRNLAARGLMRIYNRKGIFSNKDDSLEELRQALVLRFREVSVEVVGCAALFFGRV